MKYLSQEEAISKVEVVISEVFSVSGVVIIPWDSSCPAIGMRVHEVYVPHVGVWTDSDLQGLGICAAAERAILARMVCTGFNDEEQPQEIIDADQRLITLMKDHHETL